MKTLRLSVLKSSGPSSSARVEGVIVPVRLTIEEILKELQLISGKYLSVIPILKNKDRNFPIWH